MSVLVDGQTIMLSGVVGADWFDDGFTHAEVVSALSGLDGDIKVILNSGGGIASEGAAIHAALKAHPGNVTVEVVGIAASAASLLAMAGDTVTMASGSVLMIHDPMNITIGNSDDHSRTIGELEAYATAYAKVYAAKSGKTAAECRAIMKAETWMEADAAIAAGFADGETTAGKKATAKASAFDYRVYANAPKRLKTMASARNWSLNEQLNPTQTAASAVDDAKEVAMTLEQLQAELATLKAEKSAAEAKAKIDLEAATAAQATAADAAVKAALERRTAIMSLEETKGREALAEHLFSTGSTAEAAKAVLALAPAPVAAETPENYEAARMVGAELGGGKSDDKKVSWAGAVSRANKRLGKK